MNILSIGRIYIYIIYVYIYIIYIWIHSVFSPLLTVSRWWFRTIYIETWHALGSVVFHRFTFSTVNIKQCVYHTTTWMKKKVWFKEKPGILGFGDGEHVLKDGIYDIVYIYGFGVYIYTVYYFWWDKSCTSKDGSTNNVSAELIWPNYNISPTFGLPWNKGISLTITKWWGRMRSL